MLASKTLSDGPIQRLHLVCLAFLKCSAMREINWRMSSVSLKLIKHGGVLKKNKNLKIAVYQTQHNPFKASPLRINLLKESDLLGLRSLRFNHALKLAARFLHCNEMAGGHTTPASVCMKCIFSL